MFRVSENAFWKRRVAKNTVDADRVIYQSVTTLCLDQRGRHKEACASRRRLFVRAIVVGLEANRLAMVLYEISTRCCDKRDSVDNVDMDLSVINLVKERVC